MDFVGELKKRHGPNNSPRTRKRIGLHVETAILRRTSNSWSWQTASVNEMGLNPSAAFPAKGAGSNKRQSESPGFRAAFDSISKAYFARFAATKVLAALSSSLWLFLLVRVASCVLFPPKLESGIFRLRIAPRRVQSGWRPASRCRK